MKLINRLFSSAEYLPSLESCELPSPLSETDAFNRSAVILNVLIVVVILVLIGLGSGRV